MRELLQDGLDAEVDSLVAARDDLQTSLDEQEALQFRGHGLEFWETNTAPETLTRN